MSGRTGELEDLKRYFKALFEKELKEVNLESIRKLLDSSKLEILRAIDSRFRALKEDQCIIFEEIRKLREEVEKLKEPEITFERISQEEAERRILDFVRKRPGCKTSEIIEVLGIDPEIVISVLGKLEREGKIEGRELNK